MFEIKSFIFHFLESNQKTHEIKKKLLQTTVMKLVRS